MSMTWRVRVGTAEISAVHEPATTATSLATFFCAHGAGGNMQDRGMQAVAKELRGRGLDVVRFNFLYSEEEWLPRSYAGAESHRSRRGEGRAKRRTRHVRW
jgi:predicted alpha/beta-hydrolase family hydrolase